MIDGDTVTLAPVDEASLPVAVRNAFNAAPNPLADIGRAITKASATGLARRQEPDSVLVHKFYFLHVHYEVQIPGFRYEDFLQLQQMIPFDAPT